MKMPSMMMGTRGRKSAKAYKRKDNFGFGECREGESGFNGDYLLPQKFIPNLPSAAL
jgi:hypothetical protein